MQLSGPFPGQHWDYPEVIRLFFSAFRHNSFNVASQCCNRLVAALIGLLDSKSILFGKLRLEKSRRDAVGEQMVDSVRGQVALSLACGRLERDPMKAAALARHFYAQVPEYIKSFLEDDADTLPDGPAKLLQLRLQPPNLN